VVGFGFVHISIAYVNAKANVPRCPKGCTCDTATSDSYQYLSVDCGRRLPNVDEEQLSHQLDSMLSADHFGEHLTILRTTNSPLTRVPASVCKLLNLTSLNLDHNNLTELPDNCFTKLTKLVTLTARRMQSSAFRMGCLTVCKVW